MNISLNEHPDHHSQLLPEYESAFSLSILVSFFNPQHVFLLSLSSFLLLASLSSIMLLLFNFPRVHPFVCVSLSDSLHHVFKINLLKEKSRHDLILLFSPFQLFFFPTPCLWQGRFPVSGISVEWGVKFAPYILLYTHRLQSPFP